jgi:hypothetical protein
VKRIHSLPVSWVPRGAGRTLPFLYNSKQTSLFAITSPQATLLFDMPLSALMIPPETKDCHGDRSDRPNPTAILGNPRHQCLSRDQLLASRENRSGSEQSTSRCQPTALGRIRRYEHLVQLGFGKLAGVCKHKIGQRPQRIGDNPETQG